jgi:hypothetical protein
MLHLNQLRENLAKTMLRKEIDTLRKLDAQAAAHPSTQRGRNTAAKLNVYRHGRNLEICVRRTVKGFYATAKIGQTQIRSRFSKRASGAFLMLCGGLKEVLS